LASDGLMLNILGATGGINFIGGRPLKPPLQISYKYIKKFTATFFHSDDN